MGKESETYRLEMLRRLERINSEPPPPEVLEAQKVIAKHREKQAEAREAIPRLRAPLPEPNLCPECYYLHGNRTFLTAVPHPDSANFDRMKCVSCGYIEDRSVRS